MENKAAETIVIQLGSLYLRIGFANQLTPFLIPNVIAYKQKGPPPLKSQPYDRQTFIKAYSIVQNYLSSQGYLKDQLTKIILPKKRNKRIQEEQKTQIEHEIHAYQSYTQPGAPILVGHQAYNLASSQPYQHHWPILRGHFNISETQSYWQVINDIERILQYSVIRYLKVPRELFQSFSVVLIIPDAYYKYQVKALMNILLRQLGFRSAFLQQESVAALFGAGVPSACVVDIGARHINVSCVEEGILLPKTHIVQFYSGRDIDLLIMRILIRSDGHYTREELRMVEALKIQTSRLIQEDRNATLICRGCQQTIRTSASNPVFIVAAHSLFHTSLLQISSGAPEMPLILNPIFCTDTDDYLDDLLDTKIQSPVHPGSDKGLKLDQMIIRSIMAAQNPDTRKKLANSILLTGGGGMFPDLVDFLQQRLINQFPPNADVQRVEVKASITHSDSDGNKESIPPNHLMWVGGTVIPLLESAKELWITRSRWLGIWHPTEAKEQLMANFVSFENPYQLAEKCRKWRKDRPLEGGVRHIREKGTFIWQLNAC